MKSNLELRQTNKDNLLLGYRKNGKPYSVRKDRHRYFFPDEWESFISKVKKDEHYVLFLTLLHTGARVMEALHLKPEDIDFERGSITLRVVKERKAKKHFYATGKSRSFFVSDKLLKKLKAYIKKKKIEGNQYLFLNNSELPENYDNLPNDQKKDYYKKKIVAFSRVLKRKLKEAGINDAYNFSLHNIRKTYGNWMRIFNIEMAELCYRMGHDMDTFMAHYGSALIFTPEERRKIMKIMGNVR